MKSKRSTYHKNSGFKIPPDYFEEFENRLNEKVQAPDFEFSKKESGFKTPVNYFEELESRILTNIEEESKVISLFSKQTWYYVAGLAAMFILIFNLPQTNSYSSPTWDNLELSVMENYIDEGYDMGYIDLNTSDFSDYIFEDGRLIDDSDFNSVTSNAVFEYIDEYVEDPTFILETNE
tara:strand:- start:528 stop:1061 length:534 start_codon:yes stop_codon:yes gene_type:complete